MRLSDMPAAVARPGDRDLTFDVSQLTVSAVVVDGRELLVRLVGGVGKAGLGLGQATGVWFDVRAAVAYDRDLVGLLERWRDRGTRLRLVAAVGKFSLLIEDLAHVVPLPANPAAGT